MWDDKYPDRSKTGGMGSTEEQNKECYYFEEGQKNLSASAGLIS